MSEGTIVKLACSHCGGTDFSWIVRKVQSGDMLELPSGHRISECYSEGNVVESEDDEQVYCRECEEEVEVASLVKVSDS